SHRPARVAPARTSSASRPAAGSVAAPGSEPPPGTRRVGSTRRGSLRRRRPRDGRPRARGPSGRRSGGAGRLRGRRATHTPRPRPGVRPAAAVVDVPGAPPPPRLVVFPPGDAGPPGVVREKKPVRADGPGALPDPASVVDEPPVPLVDLGVSQRRGGGRCSRNGTAQDEGQ